MKKHILYFLSIVLLFSLMPIFQACNEDDLPLLKPSVTTISFEAKEVKKTFTITSNVGWVISSDKSWCTITPEFGSGTEEITVTLAGENEGEEIKTATLTIKSGQTATQTIEIEQASSNPGGNGGEDPDPKPIPTNEKEIIFDPKTPMTKYGFWYYFSFETGELVVEAVSINKEQDAIWKERNDWDIAFSTFYSKTNSGISGNGKAGVIRITENEDSDIQKKFEELIEVPENGYTVDTEIEGMMILMPPIPQNLYTGGGNTIINSVLTLKANQTTELAPTVFAIKTSAGNYGKLYIKEWSLTRIIFEYTYQPDGTNSLEIIE